MRPDLAAARAALRTHFGHDDFRPRQAEVVRHVLAGRDTLGVLPTGAGKSVCFQVPAALLDGCTVVVSPLIALMDDQVAAARRRGLRAELLSSVRDRDANAATLAAALAGEVTLLYLSPERLRHLAPRLRARPPALLAVDEAHCISEWGHDFRPSYRLIGPARAALGGPPCVALTGSATPAVQADIRQQLGLGAARPFARVLGSFDRPNLRFEVRRVADDRARLAALVELVRAAAGLPLVYAPTRGLVEGLLTALRRRGVRAEAYHAGLPAAHRTRVLEAFLGPNPPVVVATCAFGMGIDRPDVRLVVHWALPATLESYYQEAGRAGRDGGPARCVALAAPADRADWPAAVRGYAEARCRRRALLAHFGQRLVTCAGCDGCDRGTWVRLRAIFVPCRSSLT